MCVCISIFTFNRKLSSYTLEYKSAASRKAHKRQKQRSSDGAPHYAPSRAAHARPQSQSRLGAAARLCGRVEAGGALAQVYLLGKIESAQSRRVQPTCKARQAKKPNLTKIYLLFYSYFRVRSSAFMFGLFAGHLVGRVYPMVYITRKKKTNKLQAYGAF